MELYNSPIVPCKELWNIQSNKSFLSDFELKIKSWMVIVLELKLAFSMIAFLAESVTWKLGWW